VSTFQELKTVVQGLLNEVGGPGVALGVVHDGTVEKARFGITSVDNRLRVTNGTLFQIGSITKTYTATAVMRLVEQGVLDLDAPVRTYLPSLRLADEDVAARVTLRHLLTHTGGWIGDFFDDFGWGDDALARMVEQVAGLPQLTPLGELWSYNNSGFYVAGRAIEAVTGRTFEEALRGLVLEPIGLAQTFFFPWEVVVERVAAGHHVRDGVFEVARPWAVGRAAHPAGGIVQSLDDLLRYARFVMGDGAPLLSPASVAEMRRPQMFTGDAEMGLAWFLRDVGEAKLLVHGGGTNGQLAQLVVAPERHFAFALLVNCSSNPVLPIAALRAALRLYLDVEEAQPEPVYLPQSSLEEYAGVYDAPLTEITLSVGEDDLQGELLQETRMKGGFPKPDSPPAPSPEPFPLAFFDRDRVVATATQLRGTKGDFIRDAGDNVAWYRSGGRVHRRLPG